MRNNPPRSGASWDFRASITDVLSPLPACQSRHARRRAAQRNLTASDMEYIMLWGREIRRTGVIFCCLRGKDIPAQHRHLPQIARLAGAVVIASPDDEVVTLYRNAHALRSIQRKLKYRFTPGWPVIAADVDEDEDEDEEDEEGAEIGVNAGNVTGEPPSSAR
jgi:hypothetical protein